MIQFQSLSELVLKLLIKTYGNMLSISAEMEPNNVNDKYTLFFYKQHFISNASFRFNEILSNRPASFYINKQY